MNDSETLIGKQISHYLVEQWIGSGGMGEVYKARDITLKRDVALKRLYSPSEFNATHHRGLVREAKLGAGISHPNFAAIFDFVETAHDAFIVMEYVDGNTLSELCKESPFHLERFLAIALQCTEALKAAHDRGIAHRDLKPGNIMVDTHGQVKILDLGLARRTLPSRQTFDSDTESSHSLPSDGPGGTPIYMPPECFNGNEGDGSRDIFSLGVVFYECLTGRHPFRDETGLVSIDSIRNQSPPSIQQFNPEIPSAIEKIILKMLEKEPKKRYSGASDLQRRLLRVQRATSKRSFARHLLEWVSVPSLVLVLAMVAFFVVRIIEPPSLVSQLPHHKIVAIVPISAEPDTLENMAIARGLTWSLTRDLRLRSLNSGIHVLPPEIIDAREVTQVSQAAAEVGANLALACRLRFQTGTVRVDLNVSDPFTGKAFATQSRSVPDSSFQRIQELLLSQAALYLGIPPAKSPPKDSAASLDSKAVRHYLCGLGMYLAGEDLPGVIAQLEKSVELEPTYSAPRAKLGRILLREHQAEPDPTLLERARTLCREASQFGENDSEAALCLGEIDLEEGGPQQAEEHLERALFLNPNRQDILWKVADFRWSQGRPEDGERVFEGCVSREPDFWVVHSNLATYLALRARDDESAIRELREVLKYFPGNYQAYDRLGITHARRLEWVEAQEAFEQSLSIRPTYTAYTNLATAYFYQERLREAADSARKALDFQSENPAERTYVSYGNLAEILYYAPGEREKSVELFQQAIELAEPYRVQNPDDFTTLSRLALYFAMTGEQAKSKDLLEDSLRLAPNDAETLFKAALISQHFGSQDEALQWLERAVQAGKATHEILIHPLFKGIRESSRFETIVQGRE